jgi:hypothetical protein
MQNNNRPRLCRHCQRGRICRPRGLCWSCYDTPAISSRYPSTHKHGRRGVANGYKNAPPPRRPTCAAPGSPEKVRIMVERAARGEALWHPLDGLRCTAQAA